MVHAKNYETIMSAFVTVMQKKLWPLFLPDTVYIDYSKPLNSSNNKLTGWLGGVP